MMLRCRAIVFMWNFLVMKEQEERAGRPDQFEIMLRRQGWHLIRHKSVHNDPKVIRLHCRHGVDGAHDDLRRICSSELKLAKYLHFMCEHELTVQEGEFWCKSPAYKDIDNIGPTLEWYVAEWFRSWLEVPARHSVAIKDVADGGDLDVVAFVDS